MTLRSKIREYLLSHFDTSEKYSAAFLRQEVRYAFEEGVAKARTYPQASVGFLWDRSDAYKTTRMLP